MREHRNDRTARGRLLALLAALLLLAVLVLPAAAAGAEDAVQTTLALLGQLQQADVSPEWQPDIRANERAVQALLDAYLACTPAQRESFTPQQQADLLAYFEALYLLQGLESSGLGGLFGGTGTGGTGGASPGEVFPGATSSRSVASSASSAAGQGGVSQSGASSAASSQSVSQSSSSSAPASSSSRAEGTAPAADVSMPQAAFPPQSPPTGGLTGFLANRTLGAALLLLLFALALVVFVRFVAALRAAGKVPRAALAGDLRHRELFGENYDPERLAPYVEDLAPAGADPRPDPEADVPHRGRAYRPPAPGQPWMPGAVAEEVPPEAPPEPDFGGIAPAAAHFEDLEEAPKRRGLFGRRRPEDADTGDDTAGGWRQRRREKRARRQAGAPEPPAAADPFAPAGDDGFDESGFARQADNPWDARLTEPTLPLAPKPLQAPPAGAEPPPEEPPPAKGYGAGRTGRPGKMAFRQGDPEDLDAIDE